MQSNMKEFTDTQLHQENSYHIPYHYGSLISKEDMLNNFSQHALYQNVIKRIKEFKNNSIKVLDIGCGDGRFAYDLSKEDGIAIITCPSKNIRIPKKHYQHFTEHSLRETLAKHFNSIQISGYFNKNKFLKLVINLIIYLPHFLYLSKRRIGFFNLSIKLSRKFFASFMNKSNCKNALGLISVCRK